ncbi:MAG: COX15/CtaA family protein, partial [Gemmatimonadales bacterium]
MPAAAPLERDDLRAFGKWLAIWAATIALLVLIGGATRLTESGLSITEWKPVAGIVPPLSSAAWAEEFEKYKTIPQYQQRNAAMTLAEFRTIFLWEYTHRLWARLVGAALGLPLLWFAVRRRLPRRVWTRLASLLVLLGAQGALGWWMVVSGLSERTSVSQYRLAAHLATALVLYLWTVWTAADYLEQRRPAGAHLRDRTPGRALAGFTVLVFATATSGAFVAGLRAGKIYNSFPLMG